MELNKTNSGNRIHIGFFGKVNSGKSSIINEFSDRDISIVSNQEGTTTDPVYKSMEIKSLGPCLLMDTPGIGDETVLGQKKDEENWRSYIENWHWSPSCIRYPNRTWKGNAKRI